MFVPLAGFSSIVVEISDALGVNESESSSLQEVNIKVVKMTKAIENLKAFMLDCVVVVELGLA